MIPPHGLTLLPIAFKITKSCVWNLLSCFAVRFDVSDVPHSASTAEVLGSRHLATTSKCGQRNTKCLRCGPAAMTPTGVTQVLEFSILLFSYNLFNLNHNYGLNLHWVCLFQNCKVQWIFSKRSLLFKDHPFKRTYLTGILVHFIVM
jgi:hypothetical protein